LLLLPSSQNLITQLGLVEELAVLREVTPDFHPVPVKIMEEGVAP
jgi:hypothetical protein